MSGTLRRLWAAAVAAGVLVAGPTGARAQDSNRLDQLDQKVRILERKLELADEAAAAKAKETPVLTAGPDGFALAAADKAYQLKLRGYAQADGRFILDDSQKKAVDTFVLRRARLIFDGTLGKTFEFRIAPEFGLGKTEMQDTYLDYKPSTLLNVRVGRTKVPVGIERLQSSAETFFNEVGPSTLLTPNYDIGAMLYGSANAGVLEYALGVFNGEPDSASADVDDNDAKDVAARVFVTPWKKSDVAAVSGLSAGLAGTFGDQSGSDAAPGLPSYRSDGQQGFFSYRTSTNKADVAFADGKRTRLAPQFYYTVGSFGLLGEYVVSALDVANGKGSDTARNNAWQLAASYVLTGESPSLKGVKPLHPLNPAKGDWGAVELAARVGRLELDEDLFAGGYADRKKAVTAAANTAVGVNWYLTRNVKLVVDYGRTSFDGGDAAGDRPDEQVVSARAQVAW